MATRAYRLRRSLTGGHGAIGSAPALQAGGYGFESRWPWLHPTFSLVTSLSVATSPSQDPQQRDLRDQLRDYEPAPRRTRTADPSPWPRSAGDARLRRTGHVPVHQRAQPDGRRPDAPSPTARLRHPGRPTGHPRPAGHPALDRTAHPPRTRCEGRSGQHRWRGRRRGGVRTDTRRRRPAAGLRRGRASCRDGEQQRRGRHRHLPPSPPAAAPGPSRRRPHPRATRTDEAPPNGR